MTPGGQARVIMARCADNPGRTVVLKTLDVPAEADRDTLALQADRLREEGRFLDLLRGNPRVVDVDLIGAGNRDPFGEYRDPVHGIDLPFLQLDRMHGESLDYLVGTPAMSVSLACGIVRWLATTLLQIRGAVDREGVARGLGVLHNDIKPANVMLDLALPVETGLRIIDFGGATDLHDEGAVRIWRTPKYSAPELDREPLDRHFPNADVWSLGALFYELLTGEPLIPDDAAGSAKAMKTLKARKCGGGSDRLLTARSSTGIARLVCRMLEPDHRRRIPLDELPEALDGPCPVPRPRLPRLCPYTRYAYPAQHAGTVPPEPWNLWDLHHVDPVAAAESIERLLGFHGSVFFGRREAAPSSMWRGERLSPGAPESFPRFAYRVHVFEDMSGARGEYLGYAMIRPDGYDREHEFPASPVIALFVRPPQYMRRAPYHVLTTLGGREHGVDPFPCVPFCEPTIQSSPTSRPSASADGRTSPSSSTTRTQDPAPQPAAPRPTPPHYCLYAALLQAISLKMYSFALTPIGLHDALAVVRRQPGNVEHEKGLSLEQAARLLNAPEVGAAGVVETIMIGRIEGQSGDGNKDKDDDKAKRDVARFLADACHTVADYIRNDIPVILMIPGPAKAGVGHAILILGMRTSPDGGVATFVFNDILLGPFREKPWRSLLEMATVRGEEHLSINLLPILPRGARTGIRTIRKMAEEFTANSAKALFLKAGSSPPVFRVHLIRSSDVRHRYTDLLGALPDGSSELAFSLSRELDSLGGQFVWVVEGYHPDFRTELPTKKTVGSSLEQSTPLSHVADSEGLFLAALWSVTKSTHLGQPDLVLFPEHYTKAWSGE